MNLTLTDLLREQLRACEENIPHAVVTIAQAEGTTRQDGKMLVFEEHQMGTIGGGAVELLALRDAREALHTGESTFRTYDLNNQASEAGLACGGALSVVIEAFQPRPTLVMCGAGHVGQAVLPLAKSVGFQTVLVDIRPEELIADTIAMADRFVPVSNFEEGVRDLQVPAGSYFVIAGPNHDCDGGSLASALGKNAKYVGMIGSPKKIGAIFGMLRKRGVSEEVLSSIHAPIGLDIGNGTPPEIAIAILAELLMVRNGKTKADI